MILNGSRDISFTMDLVSKDIGLFQAIADRCGVPVELNPVLVDIFEDGEARYGSREWSPNIIRRLEDATGLSILAPGFPAQMIDDEPEERGLRGRSERTELSSEILRHRAHVTARRSWCSGRSHSRSATISSRMSAARIMSSASR